ncbi:MAG: hypothetical protein K9I69_04110 [Ignavibacteriales bacterium]|nr:hypothetical protein [Ignavibacteriales bacterium]MCF8306107.1 hypothetical protein [Ignavibacteriales bacterium]MCF8315838.1 hypothetical protein [Ignavibacteriales bacterium]MCF8437298.1 hypothetical protein [Ignavibacteriales bacterium]
MAENRKIDPSLFRDISFNELDFEKNARQVIATLIMRRSFSDWKTILDYYGVERLKEEVVEIRDLDKRTFSFCSAYFEIPGEKFRCFNTEPSIRKLWDY